MPGWVWGFRRRRNGGLMLFFFSNRLGCPGSLAVSAVVTVVVIVLLNR